MDFDGGPVFAAYVGSFGVAVGGRLAGASSGALLVLGRGFDSPLDESRLTSTGRVWVDLLGFQYGVRGSSLRYRSVPWACFQEAS